MPRKCDCPAISALGTFSYGYPYNKENCIPLPPAFNQPQDYISQNSPQQVRIPQFPTNKKNNYPISIPLSLTTPKQKRQKFTQEEDKIISIQT